MNKMNLSKALAFAVILLFLSVSVIPSTGTTDVKQITMPTVKGDTLYVGGNGTGNYTKIQDAIDDASEGDTVFVYNGTYYENVVIHKSITLMGEDVKNTEIRGNRRPTIFVITDNVEICEFTIVGDSGLWDSIDLWYSHDIKIYNNIIRSSENGIVMYYSYKIEIYSNIITFNDIGVYLEHSGNNKIYNNSIQENGHGISLQGSNSNNISCNEIFEHIAYYIPEPLGTGIIIRKSDLNKILHNNIYDNDIAIEIENSGENIISNNNFSNQYYELRLDNSHITEVLQNIFSNSAFYTISLSYSSSCIINYNNFMDGNATFHYSLIGVIDNPNNWDYNYWGKSRILPKHIKGRISIFGIRTWTWLDFDWHPAQEPYDIGV